MWITYPLLLLIQGRIQEVSNVFDLKFQHHRKSKDSNEFVKSFNDFYYSFLFLNVGPSVSLFSIRCILFNCVQFYLPTTILEPYNKPKEFKIVSLLLKELSFVSITHYSFFWLSLNESFVELQRRRVYLYMNPVDYFNGLVVLTVSSK